MEGSISYTFPTEGIHTVIVQVAAANVILQDTRAVVVKGQHFYGFNCALYGFSPLGLIMLCTSKLDRAQAAFLTENSHFLSLSPLPQVKRMIARLEAPHFKLGVGLQVSVMCSDL